MTGGWQVKNIYFYLVCFVTLMMIISGIVSTLNTSLDLIYPWNYSPTLMDIYLQEAPYNRYDQLPKLREHLSENPPDWEKLEEMRAEREGLDMERDRIYKLRNLIGSLALFLIPLPFYYYHWKKIKPEPMDSGGGADIES